MSSPLEKRLAKLEEVLAARTQRPIPVRHIIINVGEEMPTEAGGELLICEVIVAPPDRPEDEPLPPMAASPSIEHGSRETTRIEPYNGQLN